MEANKTVELLPVGDVELWTIEGPAQSWKLPLYVEWKEEPLTRTRYGLVVTPFCFYETQLLVVRAVLENYSWQEYIDRWLLKEEHVHALLKKAPGIHPDFYYKWQDTHPPVPSTYRSSSIAPAHRRPEARGTSVRNFAGFIARERFLPEDVVAAVLSAIAQLGARWMVEYRNTLDLGFVKLVALPFRVNWKQVLIWKCKPWRLLGTLRYPKDLRNGMLAHHNLKKAVSSIHNAGLKGQRLEYTIEALPTRHFEKAVDEAEATRMEDKQVNYPEQYRYATKALYERIVEIMAHYSEKIVAPWAKIRPCGDACVPSILHYGAHSHSVRGAALHDLPEDYLPPHPDAHAQAQSKPEPLPAPTAEVPKVPAVPPPAWNLRRRKVEGDVGQPRPDRANGVPVPNGSQGSPPG